MSRAKTNRRRTARKPRAQRRAPVHWTRVLALPVALTMLAATFFAAQALLDHPVRQLQLQGAFQRVTPIQVEAALAPGLDRGFLSADLGALQRRVEALDWIERARVARRWPDTLVIRIVEHQAAARWGETGLLNARGELFSDDARHGYPELPRLGGPPGSGPDVVRRYLALRGRFEAANLALEALAMDNRGAWRIGLKTGQEIRIGRRDVEQRLDRLFEVVAPILVAGLDRVSHVDLRYTNGFALGWAEDAAPRPGGGAEVLGGDQGVEVSDAG